MDIVPYPNREVADSALTPSAAEPAHEPRSPYTGNGATHSAPADPNDESTSLVTPEESRKSRASRKAKSTSAKARNGVTPTEATPAVAMPSAPLTRPDGTPAPVVHLAPELSPFARTGGLGEAVSSLAKYQAASGIPVPVFMPLYGVIRERVELQPVGPAFAVGVGPR